MRDDDDDGADQGMSGWAGYMLGYGAAESAHRCREQIEAFVERRRPQEIVYTEAAVVDTINGWKAAVAERDGEIARLRHRNRESKAREASALADAGALKQQLFTAGAENRALCDQVEKHEHDIGLLQNTIEGLMNLHNEELAKLKAEITRLKGKS